MENILTKPNPFLFILLSYLSITISCQECKNLLINSLRNYFSFDPKNPLLYTGITLNDLGDYQSCIELEDSKYFLIHTILKLVEPIIFNLKIFLGICVPKICYTETNINLVKSYIEKFSFNLIHSDDVEIIDPQKENESARNFDIFTIILLSLLVIYILFAVFIDKIVNKNEGKESPCDERKLLVRPENQEEENKLCLNVEENDKNFVEILNSFKSISLKETDYTDRENQADNEEFPEATDNLSKIKNKIYFENKSENDLSSVKTPQIQMNQSRSNGNFIEFILCFSLSRNWEYISNTNVKTLNKLDINILKGIHVIATILIICQQLPLILFNMALRNPEFIYIKFQTIYYQFFFNTDFAFDYVLAFYGFLLSYNQLTNKTTEATNLKCSEFLDLLKNIISIFLKFWFPYVIGYVIYYKFFGFILDGPISGHILNIEYESCRAQTPFILSLLANFTYGKWEEYFPFCYFWNWTVISVVQYSIIGSILLYIYKKRKWLFVSLISILLLVCLISELQILNKFDLGVNIYEINYGLTYYNEFYFKFHTRIFQFYLGFLFGIFIVEYKHKSKNSINRISNQVIKFFRDVKDNNIIAICFYIFGFCGMIFMIIITHWSYDENIWNSDKRFLYSFLSKKIFVLSAFMFCLPLMLGRFKLFGGWLGGEYFQIVSNLNLSALIVSGLVVRYFILNKVDFFFFDSNYNSVIECSFIVITYLLAIPFAVLFEIPFRRIADFLTKSEVGKTTNS